MINFKNCTDIKLEREDKRFTRGETFLSDKSKRSYEQFRTG